MTQALQKVSQGDLGESVLNIVLPARRRIDRDAQEGFRGAEER